MKKLVALSLFLLTVGISVPAMAVVDTVVYTGQINYTTSGPADSGATYGKVVAASGFNNPTTLCNSSSVTYDLGRVDFDSYLPFTGTTWTAPSFPMYYFYEVPKTKAFAYTYTYSSRGFNQGVENPVSVGSLPPGPVAVWKGSVPNVSRVQGYGNPAASNGLSLYRYTGPVPNGQTIIDEMDIGRYACYDTNGTLQETRTIHAAATYINASVTSCVPSSTSSIVTMDSLELSTLKAASATDLMKTQTRNFTVMCPAGINVYFSVTDLNSPGNLTNIATLSPDSTAKGVGYAITKGTTQLQFGPDGSAVGIPDQKKYFISTSSGSGTNIPITVPLNFSYIRDTSTTPTAGTAKALIGITYSYQ